MSTSPPTDRTGVGVIHLPYFLPWLGYFAKLACADRLIVLDDAVFEKRHFIARTRILDMHGEPSWLSLPTGEQFGQDVADVRLKENINPWLKRARRTVLQSYANAPFLDVITDRILPILARHAIARNGILDLDIALILAILDLLGIPRPTVCHSSEVPDSSADRNQRLLHLCERFGLAVLVVGDGSSGQLYDWNVLKSSGVQVYRQDFFANHPIYPQIRRPRGPFLSGLSIIDSIASVGVRQTKAFLASVPLCDTNAPVLTTSP